MNFDAAYGSAAFQKNEQNLKNNVHTNITNELLLECKLIMRELENSKRKRPAWDMEIIKKMG